MSFPYITDIVNAILGTQWRLPIASFGVLVVTAIMIATRVARRDVARQASYGRLPLTARSVIGDLALMSALAGVAGARVFYIIDHPTQFVSDPVAVVLSRSGFSIYGGLLFGVFAGIAYLKRRNIPIVPMLDAVAPALMLGYGIGRLGCQIAGDGDWGIQANMALKPAWLPDFLWAQTYDGNILGVSIAAPGVYPTPLYEFAAALCLFAVLCAFRSARHRPGYLFSVYLLLAGFERLLIEKIRVNPKHYLLGAYLTQAEVVSLLLIVCAFIGILFTLSTRRIWVKVLFSVGVLTALSACAPF